MPISLPQLRDLIVRSRLFSSETAAALFRRFDNVADNPGSASDCLNWFVARGHLTRLQAELLVEGKLESLFLDRYRLLEKVGKGRVAKVYRASHPTRGQVALKVLPPSKARDPQQLARFQREA